MNGSGVCQSAQAELCIWKQRFPPPINGWKVLFLLPPSLGANFTQMVAKG
jgi:hypothetical protein